MKITLPPIPIGNVESDHIEFVRAVKAVLGITAPEVADDCTPNHLCKGRMVHLPRGEQCDRCGHE